MNFQKNIGSSQCAGYFETARGDKPINFLQKKPKITQFQQGYPYVLSILFKNNNKLHIFNRGNPINFLKKVKNNTISIELPLSIFIKKNKKSRIFNRVATIENLQNQIQILHFQQDYTYRFSSKISKKTTLQTNFNYYMLFKIARVYAIFLNTCLIYCDFQINTKKTFEKIFCMTFHTFFKNKIRLINDDLEKREKRMRL